MLIGSKPEADISSNSYIIEGVVKNSDGTVVPGKLVELRNGEKVIATTVTAPDGSFIFISPGNIYWWNCS